MSIGIELTEKAAFFRQRVRRWHRQNRRGFVWRSARDPYAILLAELMLRRTRAAQAEPVFIGFLEAYPTIQALAAADPDRVAALLRPLGLAWRVPAFQATARQILTEHHGHVPQARDDLLALPGVGDYVASSVSSFAFGQPSVLVDTNTVRVTGRYFGLPTSSESRRAAPLREKVALLVDPRSHQESNLALIDLAALVCRPRTPDCASCPVAPRCSTAPSNLVSQIQFQ